MDEIIDLDRNTESGYFWKWFSKIYNINFTFDEYITSLNTNTSDIKVFNYTKRIYKIKVTKSKERQEIIFNWRDCIIYRLKKSALKSSIESELSSFSTECEDSDSEYSDIEDDTSLNAQTKMTYKSEDLLKFVDVLSKSLGVNRISLIDVATPKKYITHPGLDIDLSLYMVMKYNKTFYERYGYKYCDKDVEFNVHKTLLRDFDFDVFYSLLTIQDKQIVDKRKKEKYLAASEVASSVRYSTLGEFYVKVYDYLNSKNSKRRLLELQSLLFNKNYPWYSMVSILTIKKKCMDKYLN